MPGPEKHWLPGMFIVMDQDLIWAKSMEHRIIIPPMTMVYFKCSYPKRMEKAVPKTDSIQRIRAVLEAVTWT